MGDVAAAGRFHDQGVSEDHPQPHRPDLGRIRIDKLTATRTGSHYLELEKSGRKDECGKGKPLSANSIHKVHVVLGAILDAAIDDGLIQVNPAKKKRTVNAPKSSQVRA